MLKYNMQSSIIEMGISKIRLLKLVLRNVFNKVKNSERKVEGEGSTSLSPKRSRRIGQVKKIKMEEN